MHKDQREMLAHLFAEITARLEDATEIAVVGQSPDASARTYRSCARQLATMARELGHLAGAADALARPAAKAAIRAKRFVKRTRLQG